jgi:hypothetical protein
MISQYDNSNNTVISVIPEKEQHNNTIKEQEIHLQKIQEERLKKIHTEAVNMICRQTDYDEVTAREKLEVVNYNYEIVLNEFYGIANNKLNSSIHKNNTTTNQQIYGEIRNLMDIGARKFRTDQENAERYKKMMSTVD